jgi:hypothetical protein
MNGHTHKKSVYGKKTEGILRERVDSYRGCSYGRTQKNKGRYYHGL